MTPQFIRADPLVREDSGRVAIQRGPLVYCMESADQPGLGSLFDAELAEPSTPFREEFLASLLGGVTLLRQKGQVTEEPLEDEPLYQAAAKVERLRARRSSVHSLLRVGQSRAGRDGSLDTGLSGRQRRSIDFTGFGDRKPDLAVPDSHAVRYQDHAIRYRFLGGQHELPENFAAGRIHFEE